MKKCLCFADVTPCIVSERPFCISRVLERFTGDKNKATTELQLLYTELPLQRKVLPCVGGDFFHRFCAEGESVCVEMKGAGGRSGAALWQKYGGGEISGNDRLLLRRLGAQWQTYGYFEDGDAPVCSPKRVPLGAIVLLSQAERKRKR